MNTVWCVSCQRWLRCWCAAQWEPTAKCSCFIHTCYDQQPKLHIGAVGAGKKWHLGYLTKLYALCGSGEFRAVKLTNEDTAGVCKNCVREWLRQPVYRDF